MKINTKEGAGNTTTKPPRGTQSPSIDYNNYFANAQQVQIAVIDDQYGEEGAGANADNYYAAEVLNLHFNPNSKTRFGLVFCYIV